MNFLPKLRKGATFSAVAKQAIRGSSPTAERLRAFVRERLAKTGQFYERGIQAELAKVLGKKTPWVSQYVQESITNQRNADLDTMLKLCAFFHVSLEDFAEGIPKPAPRERRLTQIEAQALRLLRRMSGKGHHMALRTLAELVHLYPQPLSLQARSQRSTEIPSGKARRAH